MSDYNTYYFKAPLNRSYRDVHEFLAHAASEQVFFDLDSKPMPGSCDRPSFGPETTYEGDEYDQWGLDVRGGILSVGVFASNLERDDEPEGEDGIKPPARGMDLERILRFFSRITVGEAGEIQGAYSAERWDYEKHADPIVRCADGFLRVARTPVTLYDDDTPRDQKVAVTQFLPEDLVSSGYKGAFLELDNDALIARLTPVDQERMQTKAALPRC